MNDEAPPKKKRTWIWIVAGVVVLLMFVAIGGIIAAVAFFRQNLDIAEHVNEAGASAQFDAIHAKFPGQQPLIQLVDGTPEYVAERAAQSSPDTRLNTLHVLAYDRDKEQVATFSLPFWLLRMKSGPIRISAYQQGWDDRGVSFRIEDIEKHGPGIILDATERRQGRVLIWAE
jgi:hypothetical protein